jgi:hypothetical protein
MGKFKELKRSEIDEGKEKGDAGIARGDQRVRELESIKGLIDTMYFRDDIDRQQKESLEQSYLQAGREAHEREVKSVVDSAKEDLEVNKEDIAAERSSVENAIDRVGDMQGVTDLARSEARNIEKNLYNSYSEYKDMETVTDNIEAEQEQKTHNILSKIESIFG